MTTTHPIIVVPVDAAPDAAARMFDENKTPILEYLEDADGWRLCFIEANGDGVEDYVIGGRGPEDVEWATQQAQQYLTAVYHLAARESRLRSKARRQGLKLQKSRVRDLRNPDWQTYRLVDERNVVVAGGYPSAFGMSLDDIEAALNE